MKEASYYKTLEDDKSKLNKIVQCQLCPHFCTIKQNNLGKCKARKNIKGKLFSLVYPKIAGSLSVDPIEKKPLYNFLPGTKTLSFGSPGCNLGCKHCQNWQISQTSVEETYTKEVQPKDIVESALSKGCESISFTYTEPTIFFEYMLETAKLSKKAGLKNIIVSNGFINPAPLQELLQYIDAANIDYKGDNTFYEKQCGAKLKPVQTTMVAILKAKKHLEITTLIIPGLNDSDKQIKEMIEFVKTKLNVNVPWHFSRYFPMYMASQPPTDPELLKEIKHKVKKAGIKNIYLGNV